jgi:hypothetical protein
MSLRILTARRLPVAALAVAALTVLAGPALAQSQAANDFDPTVFQSPPAKYRGHAMWNFNLTTLNENEVVSGIQEMAKLNYGGFFIEAGGRGAAKVGFLSPEYFKFYKLAIEEAKKQGLEMVLYDDYAFPTGTVGGQMVTRFRQYIAKNLDMAEKDVSGPVRTELAIPQGIYIGAVMINLDTFELVDVSAGKSQDKVVFRAPKGNWKLMIFYLTEGKARVVDYLSEKAMTAFISLTYDKYQENFGSEFGKLITQTFYDEPSMHHAESHVDAGFQRGFPKTVQLFAHEILPSFVV